MSPHAHMRCLDLDEGKELLEGAITGIRLRDLEDHLPRCTHCARLLAALARTTVVAPETMGRPVIAQAARVPLDFCQGRFQVLAPVGSGGMGVVYEALDEETKRVVALKVLRDQTAQGRAELKAEFRRASDLRHPNLVELGELREDRGLWFFTMELVRGVDVVTYLRGVGAKESADPARVRSAFRQIASAVAAIHRAGLVHRDIKSSNVLVTEKGRVVVLDFGLALRLGVERGEELAGTALYMAPEQLDGTLLSPKADWYAVGVLLFEALTGTFPIVATSLVDLYEKKRRDLPASTALEAAAVPEDLAALCRALLAREPDARPDEATILGALGADPEGGAVALASMPPGAPAFVGRAAELAELARLVEDSAHGVAIAAIVEGESGIGKTSLVEQLVSDTRAARPALAIVRGRCHEREAVPFNALDGVIEDLVRHLRAEPRRPSSRRAATRSRCAGCSRRSRRSPRWATRRTTRRRAIARSSSARWRRWPGWCGAWRGRRGCSWWWTTRSGPTRTA